MSDAATTPELDLEPEPEVAPEIEPEVEAEPVETEGEEPLAETAEVEVDGETYTVPAALKDGFLRTADYTRKTQELAEQRRNAEETLGREREAYLQQVHAQRQNVALYGKLAHTEHLLEQFAQVDWTKLHQEDPDNATQLGFQRETLRGQREDLEDQIERQEHESRVVAEREYANRKDQLESALARDIPNFTPELRTEMQQTAVDGGFTDREVANVTDPRLWKMLHLAHLGAQVLKRQTATPKPKLVKPVSKVTGGSTPDKGPKDSQSIEAWMKRRNSQVRG